jgi:hypothetical protein
VLGAFCDIPLFHSLSRVLRASNVSGLRVSDYSSQWRRTGRDAY